MVSMFERYTEGARRVIFFARAEALAYGSPEIETEHLLLGIIREDSETRRILGESSAAVVREIVEAAYPQPRKVLPTSRDLPLSYASKRVLAYAAEEAELLRDRTIGAPHLLLGLLRERQGIAAQILAELKVSLEPARRVIAGPALMISELHTAALVWAGSMTQHLTAHHVLLALLDDPKSPVAQFLEEHGVTADSVCERFGDTPRNPHAGH